MKTLFKITSLVAQFSEVVTKFNFHRDLCDMTIQEFMMHDKLCVTKDMDKLPDPVLFFHERYPSKFTNAMLAALIIHHAIDNNDGWDNTQSIRHAQLNVRALAEHYEEDHTLLSYSLVELERILASVLDFTYPNGIINTSILYLAAKQVLKGEPLSINEVCDQLPELEVEFLDKIKERIDEVCLVIR